MKLKLIVVTLGIFSSLTSAASFDGAEASRQSQLWLKGKDPLSLEIQRESRSGYERDQKTIEARKRYDERAQRPDEFCTNIAILYTELKVGYLDPFIYKSYYNQCVVEFRGKK